MALFAIGDLHLSTAVPKPMDVFGGAWVGYVDKLLRGWNSVVKPDDTVVLMGDSSWGISLAESESDFAFIDALPGRKLLLKGNHDYFWTTVSKMDRFVAEKGFSTISFINNNCYPYKDAAVCGTRGWFYDVEGGDKVYKRELCRLEASLRSAPPGARRIAFLHYPPLTRTFGSCPEIIELLHRYEVKKCYYGHLHGKSHRDAAVMGTVDGIEYINAAADYVNFTPVCVLP